VTVVSVIGAEGFVGSAFAALLAAQPDVTLRPITRRNYDVEARQPSDVVIDCAANSRKYVAEETPAEEFELSVTHRLRTLHDFPAPLHVHVSSVDVYNDLGSPLTTREDTPIDVARSSHYGFHKVLAEELVRHYAPSWLIVRLAGMVGPGLRKNPVHDVLHAHPLRIHPDSQYQFLSTSDVARLTWNLVASGLRLEIVNVCGSGLVSPREIARLADVTPDLSTLPKDSRPRIVDASVEKLQRLVPVPTTADTISAFVRDWHAVRGVAGLR